MKKYLYFSINIYHLEYFKDQIPSSCTFIKHKQQLIIIKKFVLLIRIADSAWLLIYNDNITDLFIYLFFSCKNHPNEYNGRIGLTSTPKRASRDCGPIGNIKVSKQKQFEGKKNI